MSPSDLSARSTAGSREDDDLMRQIASGDQLAAKQVVEDHLPTLMSLGRHMLGNEAEAEEVAQEAFLKLWKLARDWQPRRALVSTWLRRVSTNLCIDRLRQRRTRALAPGDDQPIAARQQLDLEEKELKQRVSEALDDLPERQRVALTYCYYQGMSQRDAAGVMEISEHALESLLARAKRGLKAALAQEWKQLLPDRTQVDEHGTGDIAKRVKR